MKNMLNESLVYILFLIIETATFYFFYTKTEGHKAVYETWFDWIIDLGAILSGSFIMYLSIYSSIHPEIFTIQIPKIIFYLAFLIGSFQFSIHLTKWLIRGFKNGNFF